MEARMSDPIRYKKGDVVGQYKVVDPAGFAGLLPTAVIRDGHPNAGTSVVLTSAFKKVVA
jgi:hypothetical protein